MGLDEPPVNAMNERRNWSFVKGSQLAMKTHNPIRAIISNMQITPHPDKMMIALSIGDPTTFKNLKPSEIVIDAVKESLESYNFNGYGPANGLECARRAVAEYSSNEHYTVNPEDVILTSGNSGALDICISALCESGQNLLVPRPGFSIYRTLAEGLGVEIREYNLIPEKQWEINLGELESLIDEKTAAIVVNNPSNPCGSVYSQRHLRDIVQLASRNYVPIIADEIYEHLVFKGQQFIPIASLSDDVPILSCSGLTKRFLVPGWRTGWIIIHDRNGVLGKEVTKALMKMSARILGSNTIVQGAIPKILKETPHQFYEVVIDVVQRHAEIAYSLLGEIEGLSPIMPQGAMYMMVGVDMMQFPKFSSSLEFVERLVSEQSVFCLPGECFSYPNYFRIVLTVPEEMLIVACVRIKEFCNDHIKKANNTITAYGLICPVSTSPQPNL